MIPDNLYVIPPPSKVGGIHPNNQHISKRKFTFYQIIKYLFFMCCIFIINYIKQNVVAFIIIYQTTKTNNILHPYNYFFNINSFYSIDAFRLAINAF